MSRERHVELANLVCTRLDVVHGAVHCPEGGHSNDSQEQAAALRSRVTCSSLENETVLRVELLGIRETAVPTSRRLPGLVRWTIVNTQEPVNFMHMTLVFAGSAPAWRQDAMAQVLCLLENVQELPCSSTNKNRAQNKDACEAVPVPEGTPLANAVEALLFSHRHSSTLPVSLKVARHQSEVVAVYIDVLTESVETTRVCTENPDALCGARVKIESPKLDGLVMSAELGPDLSRILVDQCKNENSSSFALCQIEPALSWRQSTIAPIIEAIAGAVRRVRRAARRKDARMLAIQPY